MSEERVQELRARALQLRERGLEYCKVADAAGPGQTRGEMMGYAVLCRDAARECEAEALRLEQPAGNA